MAARPRSRGPAKNGRPGTPSTGSAATVETPPVAADPATATGSADSAAVAPAAPPPKHHPTIGGKKVVLEYDTPTHEAPKAATAPEEDAAAVARARASYAAGNKRLFAGDAAGAVHAYQQALAAYPDTWPAIAASASRTRSRAIRRRRCRRSTRI